MSSGLTLIREEVVKLIEGEREGLWVGVETERVFDGTLSDVAWGERARGKGWGLRWQQWC